MNNPYISTYLTSTVRVLPREMDNSIRKYIKINLEKEHTNKCFQDYGYIVKVHDVEIISDGRIIPEDPMCCAKFDVKFLCSLCRPINNTYVIAQISGISEKLIILNYGPLNIIIKTISNINKDIFMFNQNLSTWVAKKNNAKSDKNESTQKLIVLKKNSYVKVKITSKKIIDKSKEIICFGFIEDIATNTEIENSIKQAYEPKKYDSFEMIIDIEKKIQDALLENLSEGTEEKTDENDNDI